jgi:hypothetical protein
MNSRLPPVATALFELAREIADFANEQTECLNFEEYGGLMELEAKLLAYGNLLTALNRDQFLDDEIADAVSCLDYLRERIGAKS